MYVFNVKDGKIKMRITETLKTLNNKKLKLKSKMLNISKESYLDILETLQNGM